jgi:hypothetical protein
MNKLKIDERYNLIQGTGPWSVPRYQEIEDWCRDSNNGDFTVYTSYITYKTDKDLTAFMLKWS